MNEVGNSGWMPLPGKRRASAVASLIAGALVAACLAGIAATIIIWRADSAEQEADYAAAVWWRPAVPLYQRKLGEQLLVNSPQQSEGHLLTALREDPYDPITLTDVSTVELALGRWPRAVSLTSRPGYQRPRFSDRWRLANLFLSHGDLAGFWQEMELACRFALPDEFDSMESRALTASNADFTELRRVLPAASVPAAMAYVGAALGRGNESAALQGAQWLLQLPAPQDAGLAAARRARVQQLLETAWQQWPRQVDGLWREAAQAGLMPAEVKPASTPYIFDASFSPAAYAQARILSPPLNDPFSAIVGWMSSEPQDTRFDEVATGDTVRATAAELMLDGNQPPDVELAQQWILAEGPSLQISAWSRRLGGAQTAGLRVRLRQMDGRMVGEVVLPTHSAWQAAQASIPLPSLAEQGYIVSLDYHRPQGEVLWQGQALVTGLHMTGGATP